MFNLEPEYGINDSPPDPTRITQVILYFSEEDAEELKRLAKEAMKVVWPDQFIQKGNLSDLFLKLLQDAASISPKGTPIRFGVQNPVGGEVPDGAMF